MALYTKSFIDKRREEFFAYASKFEYKISESSETDIEAEAEEEETWYEMEEQSRTVDGNTITYSLLVPNVLHTAHKITGLRILDASGEVIAERSMAIEVNSIQTVLCEISVSYEEV